MTFGFDFFYMQILCPNEQIAWILNVIDCKNQNHYIERMMTTLINMETKVTQTFKGKKIYRKFTRGP